MFPPRPAPGLGAVCNDWRGGRSGRRGAPKQGEPRTQPTALAVASATERIQEPLHPLPRTPAKSGRHIADRVRAAGQRQETGHADSGLELEPEGRLGGYRRQTQRRTPSHTHTHGTRAHARLPSPLSDPTAVPPLPPRLPVPLGLPPGGRLPRWGLAAGSPATAPGAGSARGAGPHRGRGHSGRGRVRPGAGWRSGGKRSGVPRRSARTLSTLPPTHGRETGTVLPVCQTNWEGKSRTPTVQLPRHTTGAQTLRLLLSTC